MQRSGANPLHHVFIIYVSHVYLEGIRVSWYMDEKYYYLELRDVCLSSTPGNVHFTPFFTKNFSATSI